MSRLRKATNDDFIKPEFVGKNPCDYEVQADGKVVRIDRWENAVHRIRDLVGIPNGSDWEIEDVIRAVGRKWGSEND